MLIALIIETVILVYLIFENFRKSKQAGVSYAKFKIEEATNIKLKTENDDLLEKIYNLQETIKQISEDTNKKTVKRKTTKKKEEEK